MYRKIYIGVDGGGTKTALAAADALTGEVLALATVGSINYNYIGAPAAAMALLEGIRRLGQDPQQIAAIAIGDPSVDDLAPVRATEDFIRLVRQGLPGEPYITVKSDVFMTLYGLSGEDSGVLMVSGTGSMGIARDRTGKLYVAGGWGRMTGDEGSGYYIGISGIRAALHYFDGVGRPTLLLEKMQQFFAVEDPRQMIGVFYGEQPANIAGFSRAVEQAALAGDAVAADILRDAGELLAGYAGALIARLGQPPAAVGVYGSVLCRSKIVRTRFEQVLKAAWPDVKVTEPSVKPELAAIRYLQNHPDEEN